MLIKKKKLTSIRNLSIIKYYISISLLTKKNLNWDQKILFNLEWNSLRPEKIVWITSITSMKRKEQECLPFRWALFTHHHFNYLPKSNEKAYIEFLSHHFIEWMTSKKTIVDHFSICCGRLVNLNFFKLTLISLIIFSFYENYIQI